jgi:uncharacterized protein YijF (DUF1287 family)
MLSAPLAAQDDFVDRLIAAAIERTLSRVTYDGSYRRISYPGGDVPDSIGVCTDLVIRSYRAVGIDLQKEVHQDITKAFSSYPSVWGHRGPDRNIDHRRVLNLQTFLRRHGESLNISGEASDYKAGDLVTWLLPGNLPHIGIVSDRRSNDGARPLIVHNIGRGPEVEDMLFDYRITGHYRYVPEKEE